MFCFVPEYVHPCDCTGAPPDESQCKEGFFWNAMMSLLGRTLIPAENEEGECAYRDGIEENGDEKRHSFQENHLIFLHEPPPPDGSRVVFFVRYEGETSVTGRQLRYFGETRPDFVRPDRDRGAGSVNENLACFGLTVDPHETHLPQEMLV